MTQSFDPDLRDLFEKSLVSVHNPSLVRCREAYEQAHKAAREAGQSEAKAERAAAKAYRWALPVPSDSMSVRNFIDCVTHGLAIGAISPAESSRLLYAAQVATAAIRSQASITLAAVRKCPT